MCGLEVFGFARSGGYRDAFFAEEGIYGGGFANVGIADKTDDYLLRVGGVVA
jgi:hypothetical protein